jgi:hypothetical protein
VYEQETFILLLQVPGSQWEWHKNSALLELERRNQALKRQLDAAELAALEQKAQAEQERQFIQELLQKERQNEVTLRKASAVKQRLLDRAKAAVDAQVMLTALGVWRESTRGSRRKKLLRKLLVIWRKEQLRRALEGFRQGLRVSKARKESKAAAERFRRLSLERKTFFSWGVFFGVSKWKRGVMEKARVTRLWLTGRFVFARWRELCVRKVEKRQAIQRAVAWQRGSLMRRGWLAWRTEQRSFLRKVVEADGLFCRHVIRKWRGVTVRWQVLKSRTAQFVAWRKARCLTAWNHAAQFQRQGRRRVKEMQATWHARRIGRALQRWCEYAEGKRSLEARCAHLQQKRALRIKRWGWRLFLQQRSITAFRERRVEGIMGAVLKAWVACSSDRKRRRALVDLGMQRVQRSRLKRAFLTWRMTSGESPLVMAVRSGRQPLLEEKSSDSSL